MSSCADVYWFVVVFFFQAEDGIRDLVRSRGLGDVYKRQAWPRDLITDGIVRIRFARRTRDRVRMRRIGIEQGANVGLRRQVSIRCIPIRRATRRRRILGWREIRTGEPVQGVMTESLRLLLRLQRIRTALQIETLVPIVRQLLNR